MSHAEKRERLFKSGKPEVRQFVSSDIAWLWAAYKNGSFRDVIGDVGEAEFHRFFEAHFPPDFREVFIIEDRNPNFKSRKGPIAMVAAVTDGWRLEPHVEVFPWATPRNVLRGAVAYLQMSRYRKDVGVIVVKTLSKTKKLFDHCSEYGVAYLRGKIPGGDERGDEYIYSILGNRARGN